MTENMPKIKKCSNCYQERMTIAQLDGQDLCLPCIQIKNISERVRKLENNKHIQEQREIIEKEQKKFADMTRLKDEYHANRNQEALKVYDTYILSSKTPSTENILKCLLNVIKKLKGK